MMQQYRELKRRYPGLSAAVPARRLLRAVLRGRARRARACCSITLTSRAGRGAIPMAGIPHHAADGYIARLIHAGQKVAVCEQMEAPGQGQEAASGATSCASSRRARSPTPQFLRRRPRTTSSSRVARAPARRSGVALVDVSTGEFWVGEDGRRGRRAARGRAAAAARRDPAVGARRATAAGCSRGCEARGAALTFGDPAWFAAAAPPRTLCAHFGVDGARRLRRGRRCRRACRRRPPRSRTCARHAGRVASATSRGSSGSCRATAMLLDETAVRHARAVRDGGGAARRAARSFGALDETRHAHGRAPAAPVAPAPAARPRRPSAARQEAIGALVDAPAARDARCARRLAGVGDLERLTSRAALGVAHARDLVAPARLPGAAAGRCARRSDALDGAAAAPSCAAGHRRARPTLRDAPRRRRSRTSRPLDAARRRPHPRGLERGAARRSSARRARRGDVDRRRSRSASARAPGIGSLRVRFNRVFGYAHRDQQRARRARCPPTTSAARRWSGAERYVTAELKEYESRVLGRRGAHRRRLELELFVEVRAAVAAHAAGAPARPRARWPRSTSLAGARARSPTCAATCGPWWTTSHALEIVDGRHPVLEARAARRSRPTTCALDADGAPDRDPHRAQHGGQDACILRQTALHRRSWRRWAPSCPRARRASALVDRVFTRVGRPGQPRARPEHVPRGDGRDGEHPPQRDARAASCCSTRSGAAPPPSTGSPSRGR